MRSLLETIASGSISSFQDLSSFIKSTLKYTLCEKQECHLCKGSTQLFEPETSDHTFELYLQNFELEKFREVILDDNCRGCIYEFTKQVIAYLKKFNFLVVEGPKVMPT